MREILGDSSMRIKERGRCVGSLTNPRLSWKRKEKSREMREKLLEEN